jgi:hypothetical protein
MECVVQCREGSMQVAKRKISWGGALQVVLLPAWPCETPNPKEPL